MTIAHAPFSLDRMERAVDKVRERLERATRILEEARIAYAVAGGNAVALWVTTVDESAVRNTRDVDILIRREDLEAAKQALESEGFVYRQAAGIDEFLDGPEAKVRDAVRVIFADEMVRAHEALPNPSVTDSTESGGVRVLSLEALVQIKLTAFRRKDQVHLQDMLEIGLIDDSWCATYPAELAARLQHLIDTPEG